MQMMMEQQSPKRIVGYRYSSGWARDQKAFFVMDFQQDVTLEKLNGDTTGIIGDGTKSINRDSRTNEAQHAKSCDCDTIGSAKDTGQDDRNANHKYRQEH